MHSLPMCRWRGDLGADRYLCRSPKFAQSPNAVLAETCRQCTHADHEPPVPLPRALPCVHLGEGTGKRIRGRAGAVARDLFTCVVHGRCVADGTERTLPGKVRSCTHCADYLPRDPFGPNSADMRRRAEAFLAAVPDYPQQRYAGRGIVIAGGGDRYFASLYVTIRALRHVGCTLPIQVWYLGRRKEMPRVRQALLAPWQVECVDADKVRRRHPARRLDGWELKVFATLHSPFAEVLFLDADCYPCRHPEFLFDLPEYRTRGAIFWAEHEPFDERIKWPAFGLSDPRRPGSVESGQFVVNKQPCWRALNLAWFYNDHSDYYYRYGYGDKHTFEAAWTRLGQPFVMFTPTAPVDQAGYLHIGPDGATLFVHRCSDKFRLDAQPYVTPQRNVMPAFYPALPLEMECWGWLAELARDLGMPVRSPDGAVRQPVRTPAARITLATLYTPEIAAYGEQTTRVLHQYAARHGYRTLTRSTTLDSDRPPSWSKIPLIEQAFAAGTARTPCAWVMWVDADALILRHDVPLSEFLDDSADLIAGDDSPNELFNMGVFFIRNCPAVAELLRRAYAKTRYLHHCWWETLAIMETIREGVPGLRVKVVPRRLFNCYPQEYRDGDFAIHFAGRSHEERTRELPRRAAPLLGGRSVFPLPTPFRPGTNDGEIYEEVVVRNEYRLADAMAGAVVLDIGAHIGIFAYACSLRGAAEVWSVEAHPENFAILERNLAEMPFTGQRTAIFGAAWRRGTAAVPLRIAHGDGINRGGRCLTQEDGAATVLIAFDDIVRRVTRNGKRRIDLLKLDCEAAEYPILLTSRALGAVNNICAEIHPWLAHAPQFQVKGHANTEAALRRRLESRGFHVTIDGNHLWARRSPCG